MPNRSEQFIKSLQQAEVSRDPNVVVGLFEDQAELGNMVIENHDPITHDAREFWRRYLDAFQDIKSNFTNVFEDEGHAVLEWESEGHLASGAPIHYRGVSILDFGEDEKIHGFRTYYNSAAFVQTRPESSRPSGAV